MGLVPPTAFLFTLDPYLKHENKEGAELGDITHNSKEKETFKR